jgi:diaminohydroxyphosphoribosylaminopyrimidine deaminase/5-amino-6-(5-phosphoribosylamino)uracil reductase
MLGPLIISAMSDRDAFWMDQALRLAEQALYITTPNPRVGCVLVSPLGQSIGQGHTQAVGQAHAEVMALQQARQAGHDTRGATAYVTLEPCSHHGRTPPCCDALIQAQVARVVISVQDPNPLVAGQGMARLRAAGIEVTLGVGQARAQELNIGFFKRMQTGLPWVRMKVAASMDGQTSLSNGVSQWITGTAARQDGHHWRARACAVLTGVGTVLQDNPLLDVRMVATPRQPPLVVVDSQWQTPFNAALWGPQRPVWVYGAQANANAREALGQRGAQTTLLANPSGKVDLAALLADLGQRGINELHIEAGHKLNGSWLREGLVDELLLYLAPCLIGPGQGMAQLPTLESLEAAIRLRWVDTTPFGDDLRLMARVLR